MGSMVEGLGPSVGERLGVAMHTIVYLFSGLESHRGQSSEIFTTGEWMRHQRLAVELRRSAGRWGFEPTPLELGYPLDVLLNSRVSISTLLSTMQTNSARARDWHSFSHTTVFRRELRLPFPTAEELIGARIFEDLA